MKKWILLIAVATLAWQYMDNPTWQERFGGSRTTTESISHEDTSDPADQVLPAAQPAVTAPAPTQLAVQCDGRKYCSQMHSCEEAKAFLRSCPGMKMDGDGDGVPCEDQWCR